MSILGREFTEAQLMQSGVLQSRPVARRTTLSFLHPDLATAERTWIAIREKSGAVLDIVGQNGCISGNVPLLALRHETLVRRSRDTRIFLTLSIEDAAFLRAVGLPAITATGLDANSAKKGTLYWRLLAGIEVVVVDWSPTIPNAAEPQKLAETVRILGEIRRTLRDRKFNLSSWRVPEKNRGALLHSLQHGKQKSIDDAIANSLAKDRRPIKPLPLRPTGQPGPNRPIEGMLGNFYRAVDDGYSEKWIDYRNQIVDCFQARHLIPLRTQATLTSNARQSSFTWALADLLELQLKTSLQDAHTMARNTHMGHIAQPVLARIASNRFELTELVIKLAALFK